MSEPSSSTSAPTPDPDTEYEQVSSSLRHYSNLRYAILTVFIALSAGLIATVHGKDAVSLKPQVVLALQIFGLVSSLAFWWIEFILDGYLTEFRNFVRDNYPSSHWN